jgi:hypothetical protein
MYEELVFSMSSMMLFVLLFLTIQIFYPSIVHITICSL